MATPNEEKKKVDDALLAWLKHKSFGPGNVVGRKIAIFSQPGFGKTVLATKLGKRNLIITDEDGYVSLYNHPELNGTWTGLPFVSWERTRMILPLIEEGKFVHEDGEPFDNIIFDTMSGQVGVEIRSIVDTAVTTQEGKISRELAGRPEYGVSERRLADVMVEIAQLKRCSVTMLFHTRVGDKLTPGDITRADVHAAAFKVINKYTSVIAFLDMNEKGQRRLQVMPTGNGVSTKTRYHFPSAIVSDDEFVQHIQNWKEAN